jgi:uncharacterized protein
MLIEGTKMLASPRDAVWQALNDPAFLQRVIPGCRQVRQLSPAALDVGLTAAVGPIRANFDIQLEKLEVIDGESYVLRGKGSAGAAGSAAGSVRVELSDADGGTLLRYSASTEISGRVAQLGARMVDSAARRFSEEFFGNVARQLQPAVAAPPADAGGPARRNPHAAPASASVMPSPGSAPGLSALTWKLFLACGAGAFAGTFAASMLAR